MKSMNKIYNGTETENTTEAPKLKRIFDKYADQMISDEQVRRVLAPVIKMIKAGRFDTKPKQQPQPNPKKRTPWAQAFALVAATITIMIAAVFMHQNSPYNALNIMPATGATLSVAQAPGWTTQSPTAQGRDVSAVLRLVGTDNEQEFSATEEVGIYTFSGIPDGTYQFVIVLHPNAEGVQSELIGELTVEDGRAVLVVDAEQQDLWKGVEIEICWT